MDTQYLVKTENGRIIENPPLARFLFEDLRMAPVWLVLRVLVGWAWLSSGWSKLTDADWVQTGTALQGFWQRAVEIPESGRPPITYDWYRDFIQSMLDAGSYTWFAKLVAVGEFVTGAMLIAGIFVGIAAFVGAFMNWNYMLAGSAGTNPLMILGAILLILAWKTAGYWGFDGFLLPHVAARWQAWRSKRRPAPIQTPTPPRPDTAPTRR